MLVNVGVYYEGLRLYDKNMETMVDLTWNNNELSEWTEPIKIPDGKYIIGMKANINNNDYMTSIAFILSPIGEVHSD